MLDQEKMPQLLTNLLRGSFTPISIYTGYLQRCYKMICTHNLSLCSYRESKSPPKKYRIDPAPFSGSAPGRGVFRYI